jgi:hypothetical protein
MHSDVRENRLREIGSYKLLSYSVIAIGLAFTISMFWKNFQLGKIQMVFYLIDSHMIHLHIEPAFNCLITHKSTDL